MTSDQGDRIDELFLAAIDLPVADRIAFVEQETRDDPPQVLARVMELLVAEEEAGEEFAAVGPLNLQNLSADSLPDPRLGEKVGEYVIKERIASGGFGTVYLASREEPYREEVAIKLLHRENLAAPVVVQRVLREMQALSDLRHPYIVSQLQSGLTEHGEPFIVMEYVDGQTLGEYCDDAQLTIEERLRLFQKICEAVEFAHQNDWIHRDLKPANILVTPAGTPKLLDFGIAKLGGAHDANLTVTQGITGTPSYMSPEQFSGRPIGPATDVYALGAVLYELLSGHRAFDVMCDGLDDVVFEAIQNAISETIPRRPSNIVSTNSTKTGVSKELVARRRQTSPNSLKRYLSGDIDNIAMKSLRKEPDRRYQTVADLSDDIQRWLEHRPVNARPDSITYRGRKFLRRNRLPIAICTAFLICLTTGLMAVRFGRQAFQARDVEHAKRYVESAQQYFDDDNIPRAVADLSAAYAAAPANHPLQQSIRRLVAGWTKYLGVPLAKTAGIDCKFQVNGDRLVTTNSRGDTHVWNTCTLRRESFDFNKDEPTVLPAISADGRRLALCSSTGNLQIWDLETDKPIVSNQSVSNVQAIEFIGSELRLVSVNSSSIDIHSFDFDTMRWKETRSRATEAGTKNVALSSSGQLVITKSTGGKKKLEIWDSTNASPLHVVAGSIERFGPIASNQRFTALSYDIGDQFRTDVWDNLNQTVAGGTVGRVVDIHPSSHRVLTRSQRQFVLNDVSNDHQISINSPPLTTRSNASFLANGSVVTAELMVHPIAHLSLIRHSREGLQEEPQRFFHVSLGPKTRIRKTDEMRTGHDNETTKFSPDGRAAVLDTILSSDASKGTSSGATSTVPWLWSTQPFLRHSGSLRLRAGGTPVSTAVDGRYVIVATREGTVRCEDTRTKTQYRTNLPSNCLAVSEAATLVACGQSDGTIRLLRLPDLIEVSTIKVGGASPIRGLCFDRRGDHLLAYTATTAMVLSVATGSTIATFKSHVSGILFARFCKRNIALVSDVAVKELTADALQEKQSRQIPFGAGMLGDCVLSAGRTVSVRIHEGAVYLSVDRSAGQLGSDLDCVSAIIDDSGEVVAVGHHDGSVQFWDTICRKPLTRRLTGLEAPATHLAFDSERNELLAMTDSGDYRVWRSDFELQCDESQFRPLLEVLTGYDLSKPATTRWLKPDEWISRFEGVSWVTDKVELTYNNGG